MLYDQSAWFEHTVKVARWNPDTDAIDKQASVTIMFPDMATRASALAARARATLASPPGSLEVKAPGPWRGYVFNPTELFGLDALPILKEFPELIADFAGLRCLFVTIKATLHTAEAQAATLCCALMSRREYARLWRVASERVQQQPPSDKAAAAKTASATSWAFALALLAYMKWQGTWVESSDSKAADSKSSAAPTAEALEKEATQLAKRAIDVNSHAMLYMRGSKTLPLAEGARDGDFISNPERALRDKSIDSQVRVLMRKSC